MKVREGTPEIEGNAPYGSQSSTAPNATMKRGVRIGLAIGLAIVVGFLGLLAVRVKQAVAKKGGVVQERAAAEERQKVKEPLKTVRPVPTTWIPRVDLTGTLKPWRDADVGFETSGRL